MTQIHSINPQRVLYSIIESYLIELSEKIPPTLSEQDNEFRAALKLRFVHNMKWLDILLTLTVVDEDRLKIAIDWFYRILTRALDEGSKNRILTDDDHKFYRQLLQYDSSFIADQCDRMNEDGDVYE